MTPSFEGELAVAVVDAETPGNVGTIARAMKNFGLSELVLVDPPALNPEGEAYGFAGRAREDILPEATEITFNELVENYYTVGCTATTNEDARSHVRYPAMTPDELSGHLDGLDADAALVFGRERVGLTNDELARIDALCSIPASAEYPSLNLGQAATVTLYELRELTVGESQHPETLHERAAEAEIERLYGQFENYVAAIDHPEPKRDKAARMFRRLLGRAQPTPREASTLQGLLRRGAERSADWTPEDDED
ncbi:RNA methyltransferase, TrmH family, group 1 [Halovenus aranensis]|uniref:RNA methyltransferase, TrmH family, group 1 n=1 Tax=Halovenus aranensis TaxID=890420 RepID=A0A1G8W987_9EURY|nr:RNA methyltransferase [Halovenus aranensis]SDJ74828.1 RNA methyltransferase, TrmH family, group 1 [Halovenus aranensis]